MAPPETALFSMNPRWLRTAIRCLYNYYKSGLESAFRHQTDNKMTSSGKPNRDSRANGFSRLRRLVVLATFRRPKKPFYFIALAFLVPLSANAADFRNAADFIGVFVLGVSTSGSERPDTLLQLMTAFSIFAVGGIVIQCCLRFFQKRRFRRPFHIWHL